MQGPREELKVALRKSSWGRQGTAVHRTGDEVRVGGGEGEGGGGGQTGTELKVRGHHHTRE